MDKCKGKPCEEAAKAELKLLQDRSAACKKEMGDDDQFCKGHKKQHGVKTAEKKVVPDGKKKGENDTDKVVKTTTVGTAVAAVSAAEAKAK